MGEQPKDVERFIARWQGQEGGQERANYALFLTELIALLRLPPPGRSRDRTTCSRLRQLKVCADAAARTARGTC